MLVLKIVGALILVCSGAFAAHVLNAGEALRLKQTEGFMTLFRTVKTQIDCFALPIGDILRALDRDTLDACGYREEKKPSQLLELSEKCEVYDAVACSVFEQFAREFGRSYREEEVRACEYYLSLLEDRRVTLSGELPVKKKRNLTLCLCAALALALLLL